MRILLVEDDSEVRVSLKANLEADCFVVDTAGDGVQGSYLGRIHDYDAIILDKMLPGKSGSDVCREIRQSGKKTPILILSVKSEIDDKTALLDAGADDYVSKPFAYKELHSRIRAILRRPAYVPDQTLEAGDVVLDTINHKVWQKGKEIYLTKKEFSLAEYLLRNRGRAVSRATLMEHVWDADVDPFSNTIDAHITNLRRKLEASDSPKLIHTVPGLGYKVEG
jgi:two-component system, OmpR family, response regulator